MVRMDHLVKWLNSIVWLQADGVTLEAESLITDHLRKIKVCVSHLMVKNHINAVEAHGIAQTAGHNTPEGRALLDKLFSEVAFKGAGVRNSLIAIIASAYCWRLDPELAGLENPWIPLVELFKFGYTASGEDAPDGNGLTLEIGYKNGGKSYQII